MNKDRLGESMERVVVNDIFWKSCQSAVHRLQGLLLPIQKSKQKQTQFTLSNVDGAKIFCSKPLETWNTFS